MLEFVSHLRALSSEKTAENPECGNDSTFDTLRSTPFQLSYTYYIATYCHQQSIAYRSNRGSVNKYESVASDIRSRIEDGTYQPGAKLPTIPEFCALYGISKITVKHAMDELERLGLIARRRGSGTYVKGGCHESNGVDTSSALSSTLGGFTTEHESLGERVSVVLHELTICYPSQSVARELGITEDDCCYHILRTLMANDVPQQDQDVYIPLSVVPSLFRRHAESSLYRYLEQELGLKIASAHRHVSAVCAPKEVAEHLRITNDVPVLRVEQVSFLDDGRACERSVSIHAPNFVFTSISTR